MTDPTIYLTDVTPTHTTVWHCPPPPLGAWFSVITEYWHEFTTPPERHIHAIAILSDAKGSWTIGDFRVTPIERLPS